ncbi:MAG: tol-pal system protein YbgF [Desulfobacterales bacterium]|nr:tol-pal system protein YbgF [Desulfobacterales bacterium]
MNGRLEENDYILKKKNNYYEVIDKQQEDRLKSLEESLRLIQDSIISLEQYLNLEPSSNRFKKGTDSIVKSENQPEKEFSEDEIYILAKKAFDQGDFEEARLKFQKLIKKYPQSKNADNAQFWIGETYYREKWYEKAILEYQNVIEKYSKGNKVQASLLKQGFSFFNLGDKANARLILKELLEKYPKSNEAQIAKQKLKGIK